MLFLFLNIVCWFDFRTVFGGTIGPNPIKGETSGHQYYEGIRVKTQPATVTYTATTNFTTTPVTSVKVLAVQQQQQRIPNPNIYLTTSPGAPTDSTDSTGAMKTPSPASPILKAQLSAPPRPQPNNSPSPSAAFKVADPKSQVGPKVLTALYVHEFLFFFF